MNGLIIHGGIYLQLWSARAGLGGSDFDSKSKVKVAPAAPSPQLVSKESGIRIRVYQGCKEREDKSDDKPLGYVEACQR